jgi:hypothetical protein
VRRVLPVDVMQSPSKMFALPRESPVTMIANNAPEPVLDSASPLYTYLNGQGALRPYQQETDDVSRAAISN